MPKSQSYDLQEGAVIVSIVLVVLCIPSIVALVVLDLVFNFETQVRNTAAMVIGGVCGLGVAIFVVTAVVAALPNVLGMAAEAVGSAVRALRDRRT